MTINYPFNRITRTDFFQSGVVVTISGQFITEEFKRPSSLEEEEDDNWMETLNPQTLEISYLLRHELETLSRQSMYFLNGRSRSIEEILRAAQVIREEIWTTFDRWIGSEDFEGDPSDYYTGAQAEEIGPMSYRTWSFDSDPSWALESAPDDWLEQKIWQISKPWTWAEIDAVLCLWMIDESTVYLNLNNPYKASVWLMRASNAIHMAWWLGSDTPLGEAAKTLASRGGLGKKAKYQPLKDLVLERVKSKNFPSRRNAAYSLTSEVVAKARELGIGLSEQQAPTTISGWLKEYGLPANK